ncbi:topoisomerase DNA-binding C4 zinc finger domain-containing protein [Acidisphaera sp. L21]|uniref:topoisomerase DNA-binding C4 zinc finger domain-containing protein n=1 Tax=Acidisphaera sp. L21 TaxID=1641851 RepID=UPI00131B7A74
MKPHKALEFFKARPIVTSILAGLLVMILSTYALSWFVPDAACNDGYLSPSIGRQGACSHHGGVHHTLWGLLPLIAAVATGIYVFTRYVTPPPSVTGPTPQAPITLTAAPIPSTPTTSAMKAAVLCPRCGGSMRKRQARKGRYAGSTFMGCSNYPICKGIRPVLPG